MAAIQEQTERPLTEQILEAVLSGEVTLPTLPEVGIRVINMLRDIDNVDAKTLAAAIHTDPAITASVLRMANSAYFGGLQRIANPAQAIARLGIRRAATVVTTAVFKGQFETGDAVKRELMEGLWTHSVATGLAARRVTNMIGGDGELSYLSGLFHDIGKLLTLRALDHMAARNDGLEVTPAILDEVVDANHAVMGQRVMQEWRFPELLCETVRNHHEEDSQSGLVVRLQVADAVARKIGAHPHPEPDMILEDLPVVERLGLTEVELAAVIVDLEDELRAHMSLF